MSGTMRQATISVWEFLDLPEDGVERELIDGEVREYSMTRRNREHARIEARLAYLLSAWTRPDPSRGVVYSGEVGCLLRQDPDTFVGIDVALFARRDESEEVSTILVGPPILAIEILSPSDTQQRINEKIDLYLEAGTKTVWIVNPHFQTVEIFQQGTPPRLFSGMEPLPLHHLLPDLNLQVDEIFRK